MDKVRVKITEITDMSFPVFVIAKLEDSEGTVHLFCDKLPVFSSDYNISVPCDAEMRCIVTEVKENTIVIDTLTPDSIESVDKKHQFEIHKTELI